MIETTKTHYYIELVAELLDIMYIGYVKAHTRVHIWLDYLSQKISDGDATRLGIDANDLGCSGLGSTNCKCSVSAEKIQYASTWGAAIDPIVHKP